MNKRLLKTTVFGLALWLGTTQGALAYTLGEIQVSSHMGEPFRAEIPLVLRPDERAVDISTGIGNSNEYLMLELHRSQAATKISSSVKVDERGARIVAESLSPVEEPVFNLLVRTSYKSGTRYRNYSIFLDIPVKASPPAPVAAAPEVEKTPPARRPLPVVEGMPPVLVAQYGPIKRGDTLLSISRAVKGGLNVTDLQVAVAIWQKNRHRFLHGNMNALPVGTALDLPTAYEVTSLSKKEAVNLYRLQKKEWDEQVRPQLGKKTPAPAKPAKAPQERSAVVDLNTTREPEEELETRLTVQEGEHSTPEGSPAQSPEADHGARDAQAQQENQELKLQLSSTLSRNEELEGEIARLQEEKSGLQQNLLILREQLEAKSEESKPEEPTVDSSLKTPQPSETSAAKPAQPDVAPPTAAKPAQPDVAPPTAAKPAQPDAAPPVVAKPEVTHPVVAKPIARDQAPAQVKVPPRRVMIPPPEPVEESFLPADWMLYGAAGGVVALVAGLLAVISRRKKSQATMQEMVAEEDLAEQSLTEVDEEPAFPEYPTEAMEEEDDRDDDDDVEDPAGTMNMPAVDLEQDISPAQEESPAYAQEDDIIPSSLDEFEEDSGYTAPMPAVDEALVASDDLDDAYAVTELDAADELAPVEGDIEDIGADGVGTSWDLDLDADSSAPTPAPVSASQEDAMDDIAVDFSLGADDLAPLAEEQPQEDAMGDIAMDFSLDADDLAPLAEEQPQEDAMGDIAMDFSLDSDDLAPLAEERPQEDAMGDIAMDFSLDSDDLAPMAEEQPQEDAMDDIAMDFNLDEADLAPNAGMAEHAPGAGMDDQAVDFQLGEDGGPADMSDVTLADGPLPSDEPQELDLGDDFDFDLPPADFGGGTAETELADDLDEGDDLPDLGGEPYMHELDEDEIESSDGTFQLTAAQAVATPALGDDLDELDAEMPNLDSTGSWDLGGDADAEELSPFSEDEEEDAPGRDFTLNLNGLEELELGDDLMTELEEDAALSPSVNLRKQPESLEMDDLGGDDSDEISFDLEDSELANFLGEVSDDEKAPRKKKDDGEELEWNSDLDDDDFALDLTLEDELPKTPKKK